jgi:hypothetical protein
MDALAQKDLQARAQAIRSVRNLEDAERRKKFARQELLNDLGGCLTIRAR